MTREQQTRLPYTESSARPDDGEIRRPSMLVVLISSVGAEQALAGVLSGIPRETPAALVAFPEVRLGFSRLLCDRLGADCRLHVRELDKRMPLSPGGLYVVPAQCGAAWLEREPRGALDVEAVLFRDHSAEMAARVKDSCTQAVGVFGARICAVLLSGMVGDGVDAARAVKDAGGNVVVQNEATSLVWDGPQEACRLGLADTVLPLWAIGGHVAELAEG